MFRSLKDGKVVSITQSCVKSRFFLFLNSHFTQIVTMPKMKQYLIKFKKLLINKLRPEENFIGLVKGIYKNSQQKSYLIVNDKRL